MRDFRDSSFFLPYFGLLTSWNPALGKRHNLCSCAGGFFDDLDGLLNRALKIEPNRFMLSDLPWTVS